MIGLPQHLRLGGIVLAAIVGMLSVIGESSACSTKAASKCCPGPVRSACCCESSKAESHPESTERETVRPTSAGRFAPKAGCECRTGEPTEPASKPESPSSENRTGQDGARSVERIFGVRPAIAIARLVPPTASPPRTPLYHRTSRLLI
jgi:hypothetical protein